jgi:ABC-2 type transport system ATP-binding protein
MARMKEVRDAGQTMVYVSHAAASVRNMCNRVLVLEKGVLGFDGDADAAIKYLNYDDDDEEEVGSEDMDEGMDMDEGLGADI